MKIHPLIFTLWFPIWFLILTIVNRFIQPILPYMSYGFWVSTAILFIVSRKQIINTFKKPEFIMVLVSLFFTFGMIEVVVRYIDNPLINTLKTLNRATDQDLWRFQDNHYASYVVNPNHTQVTGDLINSFGYRGEEIAIPKPDNVYRIVTLGGSTTWSEGVSSWEDSYPRQLEIILQEEYELNEIEVINAGQPGYNSFETLMNFQFRALDLQPDMIILYQNTNDVHTRLVPPELYSSDNSARRKPWDFEQQQLTQNPAFAVPSLLWRLVIVSTGLVDLPSANVDSYVSQLCSGQGADETCLGMSPMDTLLANPPIYYQRNLENIFAIAEQHNVEVVFMTWAHTPLHNDYASRDYYEFAFAENNSVMQNVASVNNISLFDLAAVMPTELLYWNDGRHMSVEGNRLRAELLAAYLIEENLLSE